MSRNKILVTGANGFVGSALCAEMLARGLLVLGVSRRHSLIQCGYQECIVGDIDTGAGWEKLLPGCDCVVHLAARVHVTHEKALDPAAEFRRVNVDSTLNLARQAAAAGVRRFIFISSIGVNGLETFDRPFTADDQPAPHSAYAMSKCQAEMGLRKLSCDTGMELVIIRPPLVYGPNAPGNFGVLVRCLQLGVPLPLGSVHNQRSFVALDNLVDLIVICLTHSNAVNQLFLISDGEDVSTTDLLRRMGLALGKPARLLSVPQRILEFSAFLLGKKVLMQRLCGSLQLDISKNRALLGWTPPISLDEGLRRVAVAYKK